MSWPTTSRRSRGYGPEWDKLRTIVLDRANGLCQCHHCTSTGRITIATEVDHIIPKAKGGTDDLDNLQAINSSCHQRKTTEESGRTYIERQPVGPDGIPRGWK